MKSSQRASEWPAAAQRNSWIYYRSVLNGERYTRSPVNNSAALPSLKIPINADPTEPEFRGFIGSPIAPTDIEACPSRRKGRREMLRSRLELKGNSVRVKGAPGMLQIARRARQRE